MKRTPKTLDGEPIREELYGVERLEQYAAKLAAEHRVSGDARRGPRLLPRLEENGRQLVAAYRALAEAIRNERIISPAAEWLVDNFHIVEEQLREIREDLPEGFYRELPKLKDGELAGYPRIYALALALIAHTDSRLDTDTLRRFISSYQQVTPLSIGELWAVAITLRLALVENLRRLATHIVAARAERETADALADKLLEMVGRQPEALFSFLTEQMRFEQMGDALVVQLTQRLREQDPGVMPVFDWLDRQLQRQGQNIDAVVHLEHQRQAAAQVTVGNIITSMRLLSTLDWRTFFESVSLVEPILAGEPAGIYPHMDFHTRDRYRHVIERISKRTKRTELEVARYSVSLAAQAHAASPHDAARAHVGYYLIDDGLDELEKAFGYRTRTRERLMRAVLRHPTFYYLSTFALLTLIIVALLIFYAARASTGGDSGAIDVWLLVFALVSLIPASDLALSILNWDVTHLFGPRLLPKLDPRAGIPPDALTMVVVPTMLTSEATVAELLEKLEVHYLANADENLYFALLGDFADATAAEMPPDAALLDAALLGIEELNARYHSARAARFHLFHRRRQWNASEGKWIGWERKRGKLHEFNRLLRGARDTSFIVSTAEDSLLSQVRFCITLDSDTQLPRDAARRLVGVALHPLNRPQFDPHLGRVTRGYTILQPRVSVTLGSATRSRFARVFSGNTGVDPYTTAASDVYQDLFGEGSYTGKGLYEVDAFERALNDRVPENSLLSHDLFEGLYARCALVTDIELLDDYPARYDTYAMRQHRWTRGDWQIARWLLPRVPDAARRPVRNRLPLISRWKILDNLRRTLAAPAALLWLLMAWTLVGGPPALWSLFILVVLAFPVYAHLTTSLLMHPRGTSLSGHFRSVWADTLTNTRQVALTLVFLAHQAYLMTDAVVRTLYRKLISRRSLLEWTTAAQAERTSAHDLSAVFRFMWPTQVLALSAAALVLLFRPPALAVAAVFLLVWMLSPVVAYFVSRPHAPERKQLAASDGERARLYARRTWRFFEEFIGAEDNWLPPDNFQEDPAPLVAHRTSPTNIGLLLLSTVAARDFGYTGTPETIARLERTFASLARLQKFRGHLFNWYDTRTLEPLPPQYISTVDSGNLAGHLLAVKQACVELPDAPLLDARTLKGLSDTVALLSDEAARLGTIRQRTEVVTIKHLREEVEACAALVAPTSVADAPPDFDAWGKLFRALEAHAAVIADIVDALAHEHGADNFAELRFWLGALRQQTAEHLETLRTHAPDARAFARHLTTLQKHFDADALAPLQESWRALALTGTPAGISPRCEDALAHVRLLLRRASERAASPSDSPAAPANDSQPADDSPARVNSVNGSVSGANGALLASNGDAARDALEALESVLDGVSRAARETLSRLTALAQACERIFEETEFKFLLDAERKVFCIGYNVSAGRVDESYYDLLASESRLASFVAIAKGDAPQEHWFHLGRQLTPVNGSRALISWTGTMFEYLMPLLVMRDYDETLLDQTYHAMLTRQIEYGDERGVPWGISESAYNARDVYLNYQYGPFGVPGLGLKRGLSEDLVVAPYAAMLALMVEPPRALSNLQRLAQDGALARYGFYESLDYTPERLPQGQRRVIIRSFMAHHQGMSLVALDNVLNEDVMQRRFHSEPLVQATELLLQERIPRGVAAAHPRAEEVMSGRYVRTLTGLTPRTFDTPDLPTPRTQILSNGKYTVMITTAGAGYSMCGPLAVTRWREDATRDNYGSFVYARDVRSGAVWSAGYQPTLRRPQSYEAAFTEDKADFRRTDAGIITHMEVIVSPEDEAEVRRVSLTNSSTRPREIELTSYAEIVLATPAADAAHPAFSNLFIETEYAAAENALLARRRPRSSKDAPVWAMHTISTEGVAVGAVQYETDRSRFLGRGHGTAAPLAVTEERPLSNTVGAVLDPVFSLRQRVRLRPGETAHISFSTAVARTREEALALAGKYRGQMMFEREARLAWTQSQVAMRHLNLDAEEAHLFQRLAGRVLYSDPSLRPRPHVLALNTKAQSNLWPYGISGDLPIVLVRINRTEDLNMVRQILRGHEYLRLKGLQLDLVILNDHPPSYAQELQDELQLLVRTSGSQFLQDKPGGVFLRRAEQMPEADRILLHAVARVVVVCERGTLADQLVRKPVEEELPPRLLPRAPSQVYPEPIVAAPELSHFNGLGGFNYGGREYVTVLGEGQWSPAPWTNVIANEHDFGCLTTETGGGYTWSANSRENRLTPWSNDAVSDPPSEIVYLRDEETGTVWTTTPLPIREREPYLIRHGQGYTVFEHTSHGIAQELLVFVPLDAPVKISVLRLRNRTNRKRRLSVTSYNELVLGVQRGASAPYVITELDAESGAIFARNPYNNEFSARIAFAETSAEKRTLTCDRKEFLGRNGSHARPHALRRTHLSGRTGAGLDPCAALQTGVELAAGEAREIIFLLGEGESVAEAREVVGRYLQKSAVDEAFERVVAHWDAILETVEVRTPDAALDIMLNRWLLYQTLSSRVWARTAFYQSGGAFGFRDQLQDVMALVYAQPSIARAQILRAAARQFKEGDVQHWWHPPTGRGVRTRFSDDLLWLPFVTSFYINVTGDEAVLDESVPFIEAPPLASGEDESYTQPVVSNESATLYEHCLRTLDRSLAVGAHGLPLMGSGDWNDGMNRVGNGGTGESVWVGWFLHTTLAGFVSFCDARGDATRAAAYRAHTEKLKRALEDEAWDGDWYRRAYFDDGTPLGSAQNEECRIDSIVQSWGVISGAAETYRAHRAMAAVEEYLIRRGDGLIILFTPPFDKSPLDPGYIKGYVPGVRENGGQYTHAALWMLIAYALLGDGDRAGELFSLLNPINHASTRAGLHKYKVEPYVAAGDVYAVWPHTGRGGWTWYTGSASWMYRAGLEYILGFQLRAGKHLTINPCIPRNWRGFEIEYRHRSARYAVKVENPYGVCRGVVRLELDGTPHTSPDIELQDDGARHTILVVLGEPPTPPPDEQPRAGTTAQAQNK
ncbi:MAG TPA: glucoamylase family protein [Pyrinomonadaceae bacterium]|nr:glucoamylase family protein [Pyrinomonadaceae bacterium]